MREDFSIVIKYIKSFKSRSIAIMLSIVLGTALIVGVGTLSKSAQEAGLERIKRETGTYHVAYKDIDKNQLKVVKEGKDIKNIGLNSYYASTDKGEKLPINILYADNNFLNDESKIVKGRLPEGKNEVVLEGWILNSMGLEGSVGQELTFKLYEKEKPEKFKVVGILKDRYKDKSVGRCEMFLHLDENKINNFVANVEFNEGSPISNNIEAIAKKSNLNLDNQVGVNSTLVGTVEENGGIDSESRNTAITMSAFAGLVIYSIFSISVYQRIRDYGMLRAVGATNFRVFKLMLYELLLIALISLPIGILLGMGGSQIFNKTGGNIQYEGNIKSTPFVIPTNIILISIACTIIMIFVISVLTYMKIRKISPIEAIKKNFGSDKKIKKSNFILGGLSNKISATKAISIKNIFRNKKAFILIMLSMSIGGILVIKNDYAYSRSEAMYEDQQRCMFMNGDFVLKVNGSTDEENGLTDKEINEIKKTDGISEVKTARVLHSRMVLDKKDILDMEFIDQLNNGGYTGSVLNGLLFKDKKSDQYLLKQKLKGFNDEMLKSLDKYVVSGKIDIEKMKNENLAVIYMPYIVDTFYGTKNVVVGGGKPLSNIKVGDTVTIKYPKGKIDNVESYWKAKDNLEYEEHEFKVGTIVNYPFADDSMYSGDRGIDVITSSNYLEKLFGDNNYDVVYANAKKGENHNAINKKLGEIGSKVPGTITTDMVQDKATNDRSLKQDKLYTYGIVAILFAISIFNIINNVSYNLTSRTSEFGMLRAIGISEKDFKKMIAYEGLFYGIISSVIVVVGGIILQTRMYETYGFADYGMDFVINYKLYILIVIVNIIVGLLSTYLPARKIKESSIVEAINIIE
ncbi:ABC transporter permease [Terrisporobacter petrolearius]|uniref:ABC transporter permease n=1 Tax=Terrisporobacter petrolearius TaxID=1460447 RepID=UPI001D169EE9|nr:ABC transporter permease [Terrisporobacter petrolearius]MCC3863581.1 ABC transporter permease [Terrisporobacter petrolearius]